MNGETCVNRFLIQNLVSALCVDILQPLLQCLCPVFTLPSEHDEFANLTTLKDISHVLKISYLVLPAFNTSAAAFNHFFHARYYVGTLALDHAADMRSHVFNV